MSDTPESHPPKRLIVGPAITLAASLAGPGLCIALTRLKFFIDFQTCLAPKTGCAAISSMECVYALQSSISTIFNLPLSVYGLGFYSLIAILSVRLMFSSEGFTGIGRIAMFVFRLL